VARSKLGQKTPAAGTKRDFFGKQKNGRKLIKAVSKNNENVRWQISQRRRQAKNRRTKKRGSPAKEASFLVKDP